MTDVKIAQELLKTAKELFGQKVKTAKDDYEVVPSDKLHTFWIEGPNGWVYAKRKGGVNNRRRFWKTEAAAQKFADKMNKGG